MQSDIHFGTSDIFFGTSDTQFGTSDFVSGTSDLSFGITYNCHFIQKWNKMELSGAFWEKRRF